MRHVAASTTLALLLLSGTTSAQVAPPPPPPAAEPAPYTPPPPPASFTVEGRRELERARIEREEARNRAAQAQPQTTEVAGKKPLNTFQAPRIDNAPRLLRFDDAGQLVRYDSTLELVALPLNPLIENTKSDVITSAARARHDRVEQRLINNLDLLRKVQSGQALPAATDLASMASITKLLEPLTEKSSLVTELYQSDVLTGIQAKYTLDLVSEYKREQTRSISLATGEEQIRLFVQFVLDDALKDVRFAHDLLVSEALANPDRVLSKAGTLPDAVTQALRASASPTPTGDQIVAASRALFDGPLEAHAALLRAVRDSRPDPTLQTLINVNVDTPGKTTMKDGVEVIDPAELQRMQRDLKSNAAGSSSDTDG